MTAHSVQPQEVARVRVTAVWLVGDTATERAPIRDLAEGKAEAEASAEATRVIHGHENLNEFWRFFMEEGGRPLGREGAAFSSHRYSTHKEWSPAEARENGLRWWLPRRTCGHDRHSGRSGGLLSRVVVTRGGIVTQAANTERFRRFAKATEWPLAGLALLIIPSILLDARARALGIHEVSLWLNWIVWFAFCGELAVKAWLAPDRRYFFRHAWFDLLIVVLSPPFIGPEYLQGLRAIRAIRLLRFLRFIRAFAVAGIALESARDIFEHRRFHYVVMAMVVFVGLGALSMYVVERGTNPAIQTPADALWWATETAAVGSGDITPRTSEGRLIALALLLCGIAFIGIFTATIASYFFRQDHERELARLESQLHRLEQKQDQILETVNRYNSTTLSIEERPRKN